MPINLEILTQLLLKMPKSAKNLFIDVGHNPFAAKVY